VRRVATHILSFIAGALLAAVLAFVVFSGRDSTATVVLLNDTLSPLTNVRVHNRETGGTLVVDHIAVGQSETLRLHVRGEGSYVLSVNLPSVGLVKAERYMETGYAITEHIGPEAIRADHSLYE